MPEAGDPRYDGFRITEMWAVTAVDPADDQEGICAFVSDTGPVPLVGSDRFRLTSMLEPAAEELRAFNPSVTIKHFTLNKDPLAQTNAEITDDPEFSAYVAHVQAELIPKLASSAMTISLVPEGPTDIKFAIELGLSIMLDKPILAVVPPGAVLPERLARVADHVIELDTSDPAAADKMTAAIAELARKAGLA